MASAQFLPFPAPANRAASTSPPIRRQNSAPRPREHLVAAEVDKLIATARADGTDTRRIQAYLGRANVTHAVRYTELAASALNGIWQD